MDLKKRCRRPDLPFRFLDLATEIRLQIYSYLVVVGKVFYSPDDLTLYNEIRFKDMELYRKPDLQLLRACKQFHSEAEQLYLSKILFVISDFFGSRYPIKSEMVRPWSHIPFPERPLFSDKAAKWLKNVGVSFNSLLPDPVMMNRYRWEYFGAKDPAQSLDNLTPAQRLQWVHGCASMTLALAWNNLMKCLSHFLTSEHEEEDKDDAISEDDNDKFQGHKLLNLEIDLMSAYCPLGCCRLLAHIAFLLAGSRPANVTLLGLRNEAEKNSLLSAVRDDYAHNMDLSISKRYLGLSMEEIKAEYNMKFDPKDGVWAECKKSLQPGNS